MTHAASHEELGETLVRVAKGEMSLASFAGLSAEELAQILEFALRHLEVGRNDEAVRVLEGLVALEPHNPIFHEYLGLALERARDFDRALTEYTVNIQHLSRLPDAGERLLEGYLLRARLRAMRGELGEAKSDLATAKLHDRGGDPLLTQELTRLETAVGGAR